MDMERPLERFRRDLSLAEADDEPTRYPRLSLKHFAGRLHADFFGSPFEERFAELCRELIQPSVAPHLESLTLRSPDEGANGTCNWDLTPLTENEATFPALKHFSVQRNDPGDHNRIIVASVYEEDGVIGTLLQKCPMLDTLIVPSAPDKSFFQVSRHPLRHLCVDAGHDTQSFIANLATSNTFPNLQSFEFGEFSETYLPDFSSRCTPFADYRDLFLSAAFNPVRAFTLRNPIASDPEFSELRAIRPAGGLQFKVVRTSMTYL